MRRPALVAAFVALGSVLASAAPPQGGAWVQEIAERAPSLQQRGEYDAAIREIKGGLARCGQSASPARCRAVLNYTAGYVSQQEAAAARKGAVDRDRGSALRASAIAAYGRVLGDEPRHAATIRALVRLHTDEGSTDAAAAVLLGVQGPASAPFAADLGDVYVAARKPREAIAAYERAIDAAPPTAALFAKIVDAYGQLPPADQAQLLARGRTWRPHHPAAARIAFEAVVARCAKEQPDVARLAMVEWVDLLGRERTLTPSAVDALGIDEGFVPLRDLRAYMARPWDRPASDNWWMTGEARVEALARASLALGSDMVLRGRPDAAERCWQTATTFFPWPGISKVEVQTELAGLYARHPELDPSAAKADRLVQELFEGKGLAYRRGDRASIQQYHTVLGVFLFERGVFGSAGTPKSAIFQLDHALNMAQMRENEGTPYQPLAELRMRLAECYEKAGQADLAGRAYLMAVQAFLDEDQVARAREALERRAALAGGLSKVPTPLRKLMDVRDQVRTDPASNAALGGAESIFAEPWEPPLTAAFRDRQQFKVLADLAAATRSVALASKVLARTHARPLVLVGAADYLRLEGVEGLIAAAYGTDGAVRRYAWPSKQDWKWRPFWATTSPDPGLVWVSPDTLLAASITETAGAPPAGTHVVVDQGRVFVQADAAIDRLAVQKFMTAAASVSGVKDVAVREP